MSNQTEALKSAKSALLAVKHGQCDHTWADQVISDIDEALAEQPERELDKSSVCEDIQQLCMNGDLPWQFEDVIDWITKGEIPAQPPTT